MHNLGWEHYSRGNLDTALEYLSRSQSIAVAQDLKFLEAYIFSTLGHVYAAKGEYERSAALMAQGLKIRRLLGNQNGIGSSLLDVGWLQRLSGNYSMALKHHDEALEIALENDLWRLTGQSYGALGSDYAALGVYSKAIEYFYLKKSISVDAGNIVGERNAYMRLTELQCRITGPDSLQKIMIKLNQALGWDIADKDEEGIIFDNALMGMVLYRLGDFTNSIERLTNARGLAEDYGDLMLEVGIMSWLSIVELAIGDTTKVKSYLLEIERIVDQPSFAWDKSDIETYRNLAQALLQVGDSASAIEYINDAHSEIMRRHDLIEEIEYRESYLGNVPENRDIIEMWETVHGKAE